MSVKEKVLLHLYQSFLQNVPAERLAEELHTTQSFVCKAVDSLRKEGFEIVTSGEREYALVSLGNHLCLPYIQLMLQREEPRFQLFFEESIDSTNTEAKKRLAKDVSAPFLLIAQKQTAGRGRLGRDFFSPEGGLYMSLVLSDFPHLSGGVRFTAAAALAVAEALECLTGESISIKWVNDLYYKGKKISGILTEGIFDVRNSRLTHLIVGIGINLKETVFPEELRSKASHIPFDMDKKSVLVVEIVRRLMNYFLTIDDPAFLSGYRERCFILGKKIGFTKNGHRCTGIAASVDDWGGLVVETAQGRRTLRSGEVFFEEEASADFELQIDPEIYSQHE